MVSCVSKYSFLKPIDNKNCEISISRIDFSFGKGYQYVYKKHLKDAGIIVLRSEDETDFDNEYLTFSLQIRVNKENTLKFLDNKIYFDSDNEEMGDAAIPPFLRSDVVLNGIGKIVEFKTTELLQGSSPGNGIQYDDHIWYRTAIYIPVKNDINKILLRLPKVDINGQEVLIGDIIFSKVTDNKSAMQKCSEKPAI